MGRWLHSRGSNSRDEQGNAMKIENRESRNHLGREIEDIVTLKITEESTNWQ